MLLTDFAFASIAVLLNLQKTLEFRGVPLKTSVWDIGGQSLSSSNLPNYILGSNIIFLCYDVTDPQSFEDLQGENGAFFLVLGSKLAEY